MIENTKELFDRYVVPTYSRFDLKLARGKGCRVWDEDGKEYLDFGAGIAVTSIGHAHPRLAEVLADQAGRLIHTSNLYYTRPQGELAKRLNTIVGHEGKVFFCNSGAEANEALFKLARKFGNDGLSPAPTHTVGELVGMARNRFEVITFENSFHGRTLAGIAATGQEKVKIGFEPMVEGFIQVPYNDAPAVLASITSRTAAVLLEPVQGESGIRPADARFLRTLRSICDDYGLLMMFDEVQCGLGRTGEWCAWKAITGGDVVPDAVSWAKGIGGGFPLGAVWIRSRPVARKAGGETRLCDLLGPGTHGTTFGGTPLVSSGALAVLDVIEKEGLLANARQLGAYAKERLSALGSPLIREVRGLGLMIGIELVEDFVGRVAPGDNRTASIVLVELLHAAGMLSVPSGAQTIRWLPPLNVTQADIDEAIDILKRVLDKPL